MTGAALTPPPSPAPTGNGEGAGGRSGGQALTSTVPREYVHRLAVSEVFLTGWRRGRGDSWLVSAQWPRAHSFYGPVSGLYDPVLLIETMRQAGILLSHVAGGVPLDHPIIWQQVRYDLSPQALRVGPAPAEVLLHVTEHDVVRRGKRLVSARQEFRIECDGTELAASMIDFSCHSPAVYRRLRGAYSDLGLANSRALPLPSAAPPHLVAREHERDVVLSPTDRPDHWRLRVDTSHPVLFDHPVDHAPGMLMVEAARQAAQAATPGRTLPVSMECSFERYAELDAPIFVRARPAGAPASARQATGRQEVGIGIAQHDAAVLTAQVASVPMP